jgi:tetratricopeptide (TPR) repeat protein
VISGCLVDKGDFDSAIDWLDKALEIDPSNAVAMQQKGVVLSKKGDEKAAIEWYDRALRTNSNDWNAMRQKGVSLSRIGNHEAAIEWIEKALTVNPNDAVSLRECSLLEFDHGDKERALDLMAQAVKIGQGKYVEDFRDLCKATQRSFKREWKRRFELEPFASSRLQRIKSAIKHLFTSHCTK